jgi:hypothetical protein
MPFENRYRLTVTKNGLSATSRRLNETMTDLGRSRQVLSKTARIMTDGIQATKWKHANAPKTDQLNLEMEHEANRAKDKYIDRPLPPVRRRRLNLGAGRSKLESRLQEINPSSKRYFHE